MVGNWLTVCLSKKKKADQKCWKRIILEEASRRDGALLKKSEPRAGDALHNHARRVDSRPRGAGRARPSIQKNRSIFPHEG